MSELRSAMEVYGRETVAEVPDARLEEDFAELQRAVRVLEAERLRRLAEIDRRATFRRDGYLSTASWLVSAFGASGGVARSDVHLARALEEMPHTRRALEEGAVSTSAVRVLAWAREADPGAFREAEEELVKTARTHRVPDLQRVAAYWRQAVEREHLAGGEERLLERRRLHASTTFTGMVRVDGDLDPETGECLLTALQAVLDAEARSRDADPRTPGQRRADALGEVCRGWLDLADRPRVGGERPHVTLTMEAGALREGTGTSELDHTGAVDPDLARRLACDASIRRVVMAGPSEPLDVGRRSAVVSPALRRAVILRDRGCRFPGCDRPHPWCDAHHVIHWARGGPTALGNLLLLCRRHHRMVHSSGRFCLEMEGGRPVFRRPDGSVLEERAPP